MFAGLECTWLQTAGFSSALVFSHSGPVAPWDTCFSHGGGQDRKSRAQSHVVACGAPTCIGPSHLPSPKTTAVSVPHMERGQENEYLLTAMPLATPKLQQAKKEVGREPVW